MKYTFKGSIVIKAFVVKKKMKNYIKISVEDTGIGIKKEDFKKIFQLFSITEESLSI